MVTPIKNRLYGSIRYRTVNNLDTYVLVLLPSTFFISSTLFSYILALIVFNGAWLVLGRVNSVRFADGYIGWLSILIAIFGIVHLSTDAFQHLAFSLRCIPYPAFLILTVPVAVGIVLVRAPLHTIVIGCRIAIAVSVFISLYHLLFAEGGRLGFGTNPLIAAYFTLLFACISRFPARNESPSWHGMAFFYLGCLAAVASGARALLLFYVVIFALDICRTFYKFSENIDGKRQAIVLVLLMFIIIPLIMFFGEGLRLNKVINSIASFTTSDQSMQIRIHLWKFGWESFLQNPLFGIGQCHIKPNIEQFLMTEMNIQRTYKHLHNLILHELAVYGLVGLSLVIGFHALVFKRLYELLESAEERWVLIILFLGFFVYGFTGSHLSDERMVAATSMMFGILLAEGKRRQFHQTFKTSATKIGYVAPPTAS